MEGSSARLETPELGELSLPDPLPLIIRDSHTTSTATRKKGERILYRDWPGRKRMHRGFIFFFCVISFSVSCIRSQWFTLKRSKHPCELSVGCHPLLLGGGVVRRPAHGPSRAILPPVIRPRDGWMHSKRSKRDGGLSWSLASPASRLRRVDGSLAVFFRGEMALKTQESLADDISQGHGKHQQPSHNKQTRHPMTMTAQGRTESLIPAIQQGQPTTAEPTHPSNVEPLSSEATGGI